MTLDSKKKAEFYDQFIDIQRTIYKKFKYDEFYKRDAEIMMEALKIAEKRRMREKYLN